jgi:hypothetical protein
LKHNFFSGRPSLAQTLWLDNPPFAVVEERGSRMWLEVLSMDGKVAGLPIRTGCQEIALNDLYIVVTPSSLDGFHSLPGR